MKIFLVLLVMLLTVLSVYASSCDYENYLYSNCMAKGKSEECSRRLVSFYTSSGYIPVNQTLRGLTVNKHCSLTGELLVSIMDKLPKVVTTVYKGSMYHREFQVLEKDHCIQDRGFLSTSLDQTMAEKFAQGAALWIIKTESGRDISTKSSYTREREVLLFPRTWLKLHHKIVRNDGLLELEFEEVSETDCSVKVTLRTPTIEENIK